MLHLSLVFHDQGVSWHFSRLSFVEQGGYQHNLSRKYAYFVDITFGSQMGCIEVVIISLGASHPYPWTVSIFNNISLFHMLKTNDRRGLLFIAKEKKFCWLEEVIVFMTTGWVFTSLYMWIPVVGLTNQVGDQKRKAISRKVFTRNYYIPWGQSWGDDNLWLDGFFSLAFFWRIPPFFLTLLLFHLLICFLCK